MQNDGYLSDPNVDGLLNHAFSSLKALLTAERICNMQKAES